MPVFALDNTIAFPPPHLAEPDGLLAVGGDLSPQRLLFAYQLGIFPWYDNENPIMWWSPDPRFVMYPHQLKVSKSMKQVFKKRLFRISVDTAFRAVITSCQQSPRKAQSGTWITNEMVEAYCSLHEAGFAHSVEAWDKMGNLVGGLYGVSLGTCFFGESMFSRQSNASKAAYIALVRQLQHWNFAIIDCQMHTPHLESLGASFIKRDDFLAMLEQSLHQNLRRHKWNFDIPIVNEQGYVIP